MSEFPDRPTIYQIHEDSEDGTWIFMDDGYWQEWSPHQLPSDYIKELKTLADLRAKLATAVEVLEGIAERTKDHGYPVLMRISDITEEALAKIRS